MRLSLLLLACFTSACGDQLSPPPPEPDAAPGPMHRGLTFPALGDEGEGSTLPPDPSTLAPPLDPAVATDIFAATEFLYTGPSAIQTGVAPGTIDPHRVAILRGRVLDVASTGLGGVHVAVLDHPELGSTLSRARVRDADA